MGLWLENIYEEVTHMTDIGSTSSISRSKRGCFLNKARKSGDTFEVHLVLQAKEIKGTKHKLKFSKNLKVDHNFV